MDFGSFVWMILFYFFTGLFFLVAGLVIIFGFRDLMSLLSRAEKKE
jgi:hypothetical protein